MKRLSFFPSPPRCWSPRVRIPPTRPPARPPRRSISRPVPPPRRSPPTPASDDPSPLGGRRRQRHAHPWQPRHRRHPPRRRPIRGHLQPQRHRLRLRGHHAERLQPGARHLHRLGPPERQRRVRRDQEPGRRPHRRPVRPSGLLRPARHPVRRGRLFGQPGARHVGHHADVPRRGPLPAALRQRRARLRLPRHRGRPGQRAGLQPFRGVHRAAGRTRTPSTSRPRTRAAACRTACRSTWP